MCFVIASSGQEEAKETEAASPQGRQHSMCAVRWLQLTELRLIPPAKCWGGLASGANSHPLVWGPRSLPHVWDQSGGWQRGLLRHFLSQRGGTLSLPGCGRPAQSCMTNYNCCFCVLSPRVLHSLDVRPSFYGNPPTRLPLGLMTGPLKGSQ